jgi:arylformamidase
VNDAPYYRDYSRAELDAQYNNRVRFPDYKRHFDSWRRWSEAARTALPCRLDVPFGPSAPETIDIFPAAGDQAPIYVFIHGGYWYSLDKADYSYVAQGMRPHGVATVVNNYGLAPDHNMDEIVRQNRAALAWVYRNAASFGGARDKIFVAGHSAGGHLAAMALGTDWPAFGADLPADMVKGICAIGGLFDLEPIRLSYLNDTLKLDPEMARRNSPIHLDYPRPAPCFLVLGHDESPEYYRQSESMRDRWQALGYPVELIAPESLDHFTVVNDLADPDCLLVRRQLELMPR